MLKDSSNVRGTLVLEDGSEFAGYGFGAIKDALCEVVFTTAPGGYTETLSDPSYGGQAVVLTFPELGNHGVFLNQMESERLHLAAVLVRQYHDASIDPRADMSVADWLKKFDVPGLCGVDTRALTFHLREQGSMNGKLCFGSFDKDSVIREIKDWQMPAQVALVSRPTRSVIEAKGSENGKHVVLLDYGSKISMANQLAQLGCKVTILPYNSSAADVFAEKPDGIFLANGPGDPRVCTDEIKVIKQLCESDVPIFAICLGHQMLALALGAETEKMKFGHRGENHPVRRLSDKKLFISSQNHGYVVKRDNLEALGLAVSYESVHDQTVESLIVKGRKIASVQFHPEAHPGPEDTAFIFREFVDNL